MNRVVFLDSAYPIALFSKRDEHHRKAWELANELRTVKPNVVTTRAVTIEIGDSLSKVVYRQSAIEFLNALESDRNTEVVLLTETLYRDAFTLYQSRLDKAWGLTDCISFIVMQERGVTQALAADEHFEQAGFVPLLRQ
jgi:predicted nucleic acid-binding protein